MTFFDVLGAAFIIFGIGSIVSTPFHRAGPPVIAGAFAVAIGLALVAA